MTFGIINPFPSFSPFSPENAETTIADIAIINPNADVIHEKPENFEKMIELAKKLSKDLFHVRVDLYNINGKIYFSELTFYNNNGMIAFHDKDWEYKLGDLIDLKKIGYKGEWNERYKG